MSNNNIDSLLAEHRVFPPSAELAARARITPAKFDELNAAAAKDFAGFWAGIAKTELSWQKPFTTVLNDAQAPNYRWFEDGTLNVSHSCLDRHLARHGDKIAIRFEGEPGDRRDHSYRELHAEVCTFANGLKALGVAKGDRVVIYLPMSAPSPPSSTNTEKIVAVSRF